MLNIQVDQDTRSATAFARYHNGLFCHGLIEVGECHHILVNCRRELRDIIFHDVGDIRSRQQRGVGTHVHHVPTALDSSVDVGKTFTKDLGNIVLFAVHELYLAAIGLQINSHIVQITQINRSINEYRAAVRACQFVILEGDDIVFDRNAVGSKLGSTAITRQVDGCRVGNEVTIDMRIIQ